MEPKWRRALQGRRYGYYQLSLVWVERFQLILLQIHYSIDSDYF
jgi:hypothetical protein